LPWLLGLTFVRCHALISARRMPNEGKSEVELSAELGSAVTLPGASIICFALLLIATHAQ
jgi:hypothetical protein